MGSKGFSVVGTAKTTSAVQPLAKLKKEIDGVRKASDATQSSFEKFGLKMRGALDTVRDSSQSAGHRLDALGTILKPVGAAGLAAAAGLGATAYALSEISAESLRVEQVFQNLPISIEAAARATGGLVDNLTLAEAAQAAVSFKVVKSSKDFADLAGAAQLLAAKTGQEVGPAITGLSEALGKNSSEILNNYGILLTIGQAQEQYAAQLGIATSELNAIQKEEAFRVIGLQKVKEATQGVKLATDDWRASVQRAPVDMVNFKTAALGGQQGVEQFSLSLEQMISEGLVPASLDLKTYGADAKQVRQALVELGHDTESARAALRAISDIELAEAFERAAKKTEAQAEATRRAAEEAERLAKAEMFSAQMEMSIAGQVHQLDLELALLKGMSAEESIIEDTMRRRAALLMEEAALRGDMLKVIELTRQEELRQTEAAAAAATRKPRGGGRDRRTEFEKTLGFRPGAEARYDRLATDFSDADDRSDIDALTNKETPQTIDVRDALDKEIELRREHAEERERLEADAAKRRAEIAKKELEENTLQAQRMQAIGLAVSESMISVGAAALRAALMGGQGAREAVHEFAKSEAISMGITAMTETVRGLAAQASPFTAALAPGHFHAAAQATAAGVALGAIAGVTGSGTSRNKSVRGGFTGANFGPGQSSAANQLPSATGGHPDGPILSNQSSQMVQAQSAVGPVKTQGGVHVTINQTGLGFGDKDKLILDVRSALKRHEQTYGKV